MNRLFPALLAAAMTLAAPPARATGIILPCYGNTTVQFNAAIAAAKLVPVIAIINPDDGVGTRKDSFIAAKVATLKASGAKIVGYIATGYGEVPLSKVRQQMDNYLRWYGVTGLFVDEMAGASGKLGYYTSIRNAAVAKGLSVVGNPGQGASAGYASVTDVLITYEDTFADGFSSFKQPTWTATLPVNRLGAIVYSAGASQMAGIIDRAITQRYGWVYVTDKNDPDPYGISASYFTAEVNYVKSKNVPTTAVVPAAEPAVTEPVAPAP